MQLPMPLSERSEQLAINRQHWTAVLANPDWEATEGRIETNALGEVIVNPPPSFGHGKREFRIAQQLERLLGGESVTECPVLTIEGVKGADVGWYSSEGYAKVRGQQVPETSPMICVEVLSPRNTPAEMEKKRQLYFDAGAIECWQCDLQGHMSYYHHTGNPNSSEKTSQLCPHFPPIIED